LSEKPAKDLKPEIISCGADNTVSYKSRFLYSKYNPQKAILQTIKNTTLLSDTLVVCFSPALCYGVAELAAKLPSSCALLLIEADGALFDVCKAHYPQKAQNTFLLSPEQINQSVTLFESRLSDFLGNKLPPPGTFKRLLRIDFSAGTSLNPALYDNIERMLANALSQFWKNRATLMQLGRLYCRNIFLNLARLPFTGELPQKQIKSAILVVASGPATDALLTLDAHLLQQFYIIAVDTALPVLQEKNIMPNLVVQLEAQFAIEAAYIGAGKTKLCVAADLVSRRHNAHWYFFSAFTDACFINRMRAAKILPVQIPAMGSVALSAVYIALRFRANETVPVFIAGADFSFTPGKTHCNGTPAHTTQLLITNKLKPVQDFAAAYRQGAYATRDKNNNAVITDPALAGYAASFTALFSGTPSLFDAGKTGMPLGLPCVALEDLLSFTQKKEGSVKDAREGLNECEHKRAHEHNRVKAVLDFLTGEENALLQLKKLLSGKDTLSESERSSTIRALLEEHEYLYLHFPDGYRVSMDIAFLKRVRAQIDFFLKDIRRAKALLVF
jgi:hypothetical protein